MKNNIIIKNNFSKVFLKTEKLKIKSSSISFVLNQIIKGIEKKKDVFHSFSKNFSFCNKIRNYNQTLEKCHETVGVAILNTSITIVFGFSILVLSNFIPTIYFGVFTGIAMLFAMVSVLTLLPALLIKFKPFHKN